MKSKIELKFYCYLDEANMQKHVLPPDALDVEESEEKDDQGKLELDAEAGALYPIGTVFSAFYPQKEVAYDYFIVIADEDGSRKCRSASSEADYIYKEEELTEKLASQQFRTSTQKMFDVFAKHGKVLDDGVIEEDFVELDESEETEAPITADGTTVEEAVKKAVRDLVGHLDQPLVLSGTDNGIWSNKILDGEVKVCKDEVHDLLDNESRGLRAVFVLTLKDDK